MNYTKYGNRINKQMKHRHTVFVLQYLQNEAQIKNSLCLKPL